MHLTHHYGCSPVGGLALSTRRRRWSSRTSSYASSGSSRWRHSLQDTLPGARATALEQPSCWHRLPPPCAWQCCVPPLSARLVQPTCWHRLPPPCGKQYCVPTEAAGLGQPKCWHRLPPAVRLAMLRAVLSSGLLEQPSCWHRLPPPWRCSSACRLQHPLSSRPLGTACRPHARGSAPCFITSAPCRLERT
jgi:hypothetical protein